MHKGRAKPAAGGSPALLPVSVVAGRAHGPACSGTPSKWRRGGGGAARRAAQLAALAVALLLWHRLLPAAPEERPALARQAGAAVGAAGGGVQERGVQRRTAAEQQQQQQQQQQREQPAQPGGAASGTSVAPPPPRVALLFLVRGHIPLEPLWREFFEAAAEVEPVALPPPFGASRRRLSADASSGAADGELAGGGAGFAAVGGELRPGDEAAEQQAQLQQQQQGEQQGEGQGQGAEQRPQLGEGQQWQEEGEGQQQGGEEAHWPPLTEFQQQQVAANQQLAAALGAGEAVQTALAEAAAATTMQAPRSSLSPVDPAGSVARQDLFSVYVHTLPGFAYENGSLFSGYQIDRRVYVRWGQYTVAEAERRLIWAALQDPRNQRFLLASETCAPLYPPHVLYLQLLSERRSRLNACAPPNGATVGRWTSALYMPGVLGPLRWRKSAQWKSLTRRHAQLVAADRRLAPRFERECYSYLPPRIPQPPYVAAQNRTWVPRTCVSDEHYIPTLLAVHGLDAETTCSDCLTAADWVTGLWSPTVHTAAEVGPGFLARLRREQWSEVDCGVGAAAASAAAMFRRRGAGATLAGGALPGPAGGARRAQAQAQQRGAAAPPRFQPLSPKCYLLARKFAPDAVPALLALARDCEHGTAISAACLPGDAGAPPG